MCVCVCVCASVLILERFRMKVQCYYLRADMKPKDLIIINTNPLLEVSCYMHNYYKCVKSEKSTMFISTW